MSDADCILTDCTRRNVIVNGSNAMVRIERETVAAAEEKKNKIKVAIKWQKFRFRARWFARYVGRAALKSRLRSCARLKAPDKYKFARSFVRDRI